MAKLFSEASADDLLHGCLEALLEHGEPTNPTRGAATELRGVVLELSNPLARLSRSAARGLIFSPLGETLWYLSKTNSEEFISYFIKYYQGRGQAGQIWAGYGERLFAFDGFDQIKYTIDRLRTNPDSRQAVIQIYDHDDVTQERADVPCTCTLQYFVRGGALHALTHMRSNDAFRGLPHDVFAFTFLQELIARSIGVALGSYTHFVGSMHLYEKEREGAEQFLREGWQSSTRMPAMPASDPWNSVADLLEFESRARDPNVDPLGLELSPEPYWADLQRLLVIFALLKRQRQDEVSNVADALANGVYRVYVDDRLDSSTPE